MQKWGENNFIRIPGVHHFVLLALPLTNKLGISVRWQVGQHPIYGISRSLHPLMEGVRIQLEFGRLTNMSMATIAKSGQLALQATPSGLAHAKYSQDR